MQPHQQVLALGILWLATLVVLPFLFATARRRAHALGFLEGQEIKEVADTLHIRQLEQDLAMKQVELDNARIQAEADQRKHHLAVAGLKGSIRELEARIMVYTGLAVIRADYELLIGAAETLRLTERTLNAMKATQQASRAGLQAAELDSLAKRVHVQLRETPATAANVEAAA